MSVIRQSRQSGPMPESETGYIARARLDAANPPLVVGPDDFAAALAAAGLDAYIDQAVARIAANRVWTGKLLSEVRTAVLRIEVPAGLLGEISLLATSTFAPGGSIDVVHCSLDSASAAESYFEARGLTEVEDVLTALRQAWAAQFGEVANYFSRGRLPQRSAVVIGSKLPAGCSASPGVSPVIGLVPAHEVDALYGLDLGACSVGFQRLLLKKAWYRRFCAEHRIRTYALSYAFYDASSLEDTARQIDAGMKRQILQLDAGFGPRLVRREDIIEALSALRSANLLSDGRTSCVQAGEVIAAEYQGFATLLDDGNVLIEAFPGGIHGTKDGAFAATTCLVSNDGLLLSNQPAVFALKALLTIDGWSAYAAAPYQLTLPQVAMLEIAGMARKLAELGEARLEWYVANGLAYLKDLSLESRRLATTQRSRVLSAGRAEGAVLRIDDLDELDQLSQSYGLSVVNHDDQQASVIENQTVRSLLRRIEALGGEVILVAEYPSIGLLPLIPYVKGFVFERGAMLCHTAIVLRESGVPAILLPHALASIRDGERLAIDATGVRRFK
jgi:phosphohistidine swiveling domain-containing protein